jgi:hypothetical protein
MAEDSGAFKTNPANSSQIWAFVTIPKAPFLGQIPPPGGSAHADIYRAPGTGCGILEPA